MTTTTGVLFVLNVILALGLMYRSVGDRWGVTIDHRMLFAAGALFYWIVPVAAAVLKPFGRQDLAVQAWYDLFDGIPRNTIFAYLSLCALYLLAFWLGTTLRRHMIDRAPRELEFQSSLLVVLFPLCGLLAVYLVWRLRSEFFGSYAIIFETTQGGARGPFMAFSLFLLSILLLVMDARRGDLSRPSLRQLVATPWSVLYTITLIGLLGLGGRMYIVTGIIALATYWSIWYRRIATHRLGVVVLLGALAAGAIGLIRFGFDQSGFNVVSLVANIFLEPIFTSFSLFDFLRQGRLELFNTPIQLASQFLNLVPSFVLPNKVDLMLEPADLGYSAIAPLGALNSFVSLLINFGAIGSAFFLFGFSFCLEGLRRHGTVLSRVMYAMICGVIPFSFFRDPFYASMVKGIFQLSVMMPLLTVIGLHVLTRAGQATTQRQLLTLPPMPKGG